MTITAFPLQAPGVTFGEATFYDLLDDLFGAGVVTGCAVVQNPGGADMSVTVQAGRAVVAVTGGGKRIFKNSANSNSGVPGLLNATDWIATFTAAHGTHPRIDRVVAQVQDNLVDASGENRGMLRVVAGTATSGATLSNLTGAAAVPDGCEHLAYVLVPAGSTTVTTANILNTTQRSAVGRGMAAGAPELLRYYLNATVAPVNGVTAGLCVTGRTWASSIAHPESDFVGWDATNKRPYAKVAGLYRATARVGYALESSVASQLVASAILSASGGGSDIASWIDADTKKAYASPLLELTVAMDPNEHIGLSLYLSVSAGTYNGYVNFGAAETWVQLEYLGPAA